MQLLLNPNSRGTLSMSAEGGLWGLAPRRSSAWHGMLIANVMLSLLIPSLSVALAMTYATSAQMHPLHGLPSTSYEWHKVMPQLVTRQTVVAFDLRGWRELSIPGSGYVGDRACYFVVSERSATATSSRTVRSNERLRA